MNLVSAWGSTIYKRNLTEKVVYFCIEKLLPRFKTLDICIQLSNNMDQADGYCLNVNSREFVLEIDNRLRGDDFISAICHEMVHVKQHVVGELEDVSLSIKKWKGQEWITLYETIDDYMNFPWEKEAYSKQETLLNEFKESRRSSAG